MLTANAVGYKAAGNSYIAFKVSDGTTKSTISVDITDLKKINGVTLAKLKDPVAGDGDEKNEKVYLAATADQDDQATLTANWDSNADGNADVQTDANIEHFLTAQKLADVFPAGTLLKVTTNEDGDVTGIATSVTQNAIKNISSATGAGPTTIDEGETAAADYIAQTAGGKDQVFKPGLTTIVTNGTKKLSISDDAEVWIANADFSTVKKQTYAEYTGTSLKAQNENVLIVPSGTAVKQVVILDSKTTLGDAEVASKEWGVVTESLVGYVDADHTNALKKLTVLAPDGEKVVYENIKNTMTGKAKGSIVYVELDSSGQVIRINDNTDMTNDGVDISVESALDKTEDKLSNNDDGFDNNSMLKDDDHTKWIVEAADGAVVAKYDGTKVTTTTISAINNEESMDDYNTIIYNTVRVNGNDIEASVIVAIKDSATAAYAAAKLALAGVEASDIQTFDRTDMDDLETAVAAKVAIELADATYTVSVSDPEIVTDTDNDGIVSTGDKVSYVVTISKAGYSKNIICTGTVVAHTLAAADITWPDAPTAVDTIGGTATVDAPESTTYDPHVTYTYALAAGADAKGWSFDADALEATYTPTTGQGSDQANSTTLTITATGDGEYITGSVSKQIALAETVDES